MAARNRAIPATLAVCLAAAACVIGGPWAFREVGARLGRSTIESRLAEVGPRVEPLWRARAAAAGVAFPPPNLCLVVLKAERRVLLFGGTALLAAYDITAASGGAGPKLREGDKQVPEGFYAVKALNPNSRFRLSLRVDYPNARDVSDAVFDGRSDVDLGGDIMIHGGAASIGCVAIGDTAIEEVFWLAATVGIQNIELVMAPDASPALRVGRGGHAWVDARYRELDERLRLLGVPLATSPLP